MPSFFSSLTHTLSSSFGSGTRTKDVSEEKKKDSRQGFLSPWVSGGGNTTSGAMVDPQVKKARMEKSIGDENGCPGMHVLVSAAGDERAGPDDPSARAGSGAGAPADRDG